MSVPELKEKKWSYQVLGDGPAVIFIHPPALTSVCFRSEALALSEFCKTVLFDIRGHGESEPSEERMTYSVVAEDIENLMDDLGIQKAFLCGYSMGGSIVLEFLLRNPGRAFGGVLIGGISEVSDSYLKSRISIGAALSNRKIFRVLAFALAISHANSVKLCREIYKNIMKSNVQSVREYYQYGLKYHCTEQLSEVNVPVLLIYGQKDTHFHYYGRLLKQKLQKSTLVFVPGAGHRIPTFFSKELNAAMLAFIKHYSDEFAI